MNSPKKKKKSVRRHVSNKLPWESACVTVGCWRDCVLVTPLGEDSQKLALGFSGLCPMCRFCLIPFIVANLRHESDCMLSPRSLPAGSLNLGEVLGTLNA